MEYQNAEKSVYLHTPPVPSGKCMNNFSLPSTRPIMFDLISLHRYDSASYMIEVSISVQRMLWWRKGKEEYSVDLGTKSIFIWKKYKVFLLHVQVCMYPDKHFGCLWLISVRLLNLVVEDVDKGHSGFNKMPKQAFSLPSKSWILNAKERVGSLLADVGVECSTYIPFDSASSSDAICLECINLDTKDHPFVFGCTFGPEINANKYSNTVRVALLTLLISRLNPQFHVLCLGREVTLARQIPQGLVDCLLHLLPWN